MSLVDKGGAREGDYANSLGDCSRSDLTKGYHDMGPFEGHTKSDARERTRNNGGNDV
ncbi:MAG: hypothetical protein PHT88_04750 [Candidatus Moranbacteria bacterium]|nr:hypothetical protein [Candidatus Moranbacteria bacterium]